MNHLVLGWSLVQAPANLRDDRPAGVPAHRWVGLPAQTIANADAPRPALRVVR